MKLYDKLNILQSDSGGPLSCRKTTSSPWVIAGVASWGVSNCSGTYPSVYTRTSYYREWIDKQTGSRPDLGTRPNEPPTNIRPVVPPTTIGPEEPPTTISPEEPPTTIGPEEPPTTIGPEEPPTTIQPEEPPTTMRFEEPPTTIQPAAPSTTTHSTTKFFPSTIKEPSSSPRPYRYILENQASTFQASNQWFVLLTVCLNMVYIGI